MSPHSGASALFVSDGPISSNSGRNGGKNAGRNCVSALPQRAIPGCDFPRLLAGKAFCRRCRIKGLCLRSSARRLTRPLASATVGVFRSCPPHPQAFPLMRSQGDGCPGRTSSSLPLDGRVPPKGADEVSPRSGASALFVSTGDSFAPRRELLLSAVTKVAKSTGRNYVSALPQRATVGCDFPHLLAGIAFRRRCRSPDCASTAFRCRCLLLRQKLFVLLRRRLLYPVPNGHTYLCRRKAAKARFDNRHSTSAPTPTLTAVSGSGARGTSDPLNRQRPPPHFMRECIPPNLHLPAPRQGVLRP